MPAVTRSLVLALLALAAGATAAQAASLPANQRFTDARGRAELITRSGGRGSVSATTRCGRLTDQPVRIVAGAVRSRAGARYRISGVVQTSSQVRLRIARRGCSATYTLRRRRSE